MIEIDGKQVKTLEEWLEEADRRHNLPCVENAEEAKVIRQVATDAIALRKWQVCRNCVSAWSMIHPAGPAHIDSWYNVRCQDNKSPCYGAEVPQDFGCNHWKERT